jgi:tRNA dimethylallyltransferase
MVAAGLADEVRGLLARGYDADLPSMQGLGYREFVQVVGGTLDEGEALRRMQRDTMRYAKRQWTWFAREPDVQWLDMELAGGPEGAAELVERRLRQGGLMG